MDAAKAKPDANEIFKAPPIPVLPETPAKTDAKAAPVAKADAKTDAKEDGFNKLWILLAILVILAGGYAKYKYF
jgi:hypothetical protein